MEFRRDSFYGLNFDWYCADSQGAVAQFRSGFGPIPSSVFSNEDAYGSLERFFGALGKITTSLLSAEGQYRASHKGANFSLSTPQASKGLYIYDNKEYSSLYEQILLPVRPLKVAELPEDIQVLLSPLTFPNLAFAELTLLDITEHFACD